jgi:two-component system sensor histidine kinase KdpD
VGLGLAVAKGFVEAMGGELTLEDTPGGGLTSVISLPAAAGTRSDATPPAGAARELNPATPAGTEREPAAP